MKFNDVSIGLRELIKSRNLTYKEVAAKLKMSESGVKKLLTSGDISFNKLGTILELLDVEMKELLAFKRKNYPPLTERQEDFLLKNTSHYNFFIQLHHFRNDLKLLQKENAKLSKIKIRAYINDLKRIELLVENDGVLQSVVENGFVASKKLDGFFLKRAHSVIQKIATDSQSTKRAPWSFEGLGHFSLSPKSAMEYQLALKTLLDEFSIRSERERTLLSREKLVSVGSLLVNVPLRMKDLFPI